MTARNFNLLMARAVETVIYGPVDMEHTRAAKMGEPLIETLEYAAAARQRAALYVFLAALLNQQPDAGMVQRLRGVSLEPMFALVSEQAGRSDARTGLEAIGAWTAETAALDVEAAAQQLAVDWVRLFRGLRRGIAPVPPYESLYTGDEQGTRVIGAVLSAYRRHGARLCDGVYDQPDYLGLELGFIGFLAEHEAQAWEAGEKVRATDLFQTANEFLEAHPRKWADKFCEAAVREAQTAFYRGALLLMKAVLVEE